MLYDAYESRIQKIARVLNFIRKHALILSIALALVVALIVTLLATKGLAGATACPAEVTYGESISFESNAFLSDVTFEFRGENGTWSAVQPHAPGKYAVRAVGISIGGEPRYGKESSFTILPRALDVQVSDSTVVYGEMPTVSPLLPYGDKLQCDRVIFEDILQTSTNVTPDAASIRILSKDGTDVTDYYLLHTLSTPITLTPRPLGVTVETATQTYDAQKFSYDKYEIHSGSLAERDTLQASFDKWLIDAGELVNQPALRVFNGAGQDVTHHYAITEQIGKLIVEKRPLVITTGTTAPLYYDTQEHANRTFTLSGETPLVAGHRLEIVTAAAPVNAGVYENVLTFRVVDKNGKDHSKNYSLLVNYGSIQIDPRPVSVSTGSDSWIYDATAQTLPVATLSGLLAGHTHIVQNATSITDVGSVSNRLTVRILDGNSDVTDNYALTYTYGSLSVTQRPVEVKPLDVEFIYDGLMHEGGEPFVTEASPYPLVAGHILNAVVTGAQTDVGTAVTALSDLTVLEGTRDVTQNYQFIPQKGTVKVTPRPICIAIELAEKVYDATPLTSTAFTVKPVPPLPFALVEGHRVTDVKTQGSQTDVGSSKNLYLSCRVTDGERDVTGNYAPEGTTGTLTVTPRPITVSSGSAQKVYDGTPLVCHDPITVSEGSLVADHYLDMHATGSITEVGVAPNTIEGTVRDGKQQDVGGNYQILPNTGKLEVLPPAVIVVTTGSAEAPYTGNPLICKEITYTFQSGSLLKGHRITLKTTGSQTEIGKSYNTFEISITDAQGKDVTELYEIKKDLGTLLVYDPNEDEGGGGGSGGGEGGGSGNLDTSGSLKGSTEEGDEEPVLVLRLRSTVSGKVYLRLMSFGNFTGQGFATATPYSLLLDSAYSYNYLTGISLENAGFDPAFMEIQSFTDQYLLPYYLGLGKADYDLQTSDVYHTGEGMTEYALPYYVYGGTGAGLPTMSGAYAAAELAYRSFVYQNYLKGGDEATRAALQQIIATEKWDPNDPDIVTKVAAYVQSIAVYKMDYNVAIDEAENGILAFLEYKEGVCRQFAALGTMLFRELGIPARYTVGYVGESTQGAWSEVNSDSGHAWVEIYIDGVGWIPVEVTGGGGNHNPPLPTLEITPTYQSKPFDGTPLYAVNEIDIDPALSELLKQGYTYEVSVSGERTEIGRGESEIVSFTLYDPDGKDVTELFKIVYHKGTLEILDSGIQLIKVYLYQLQKYYDGTPLFYADGDFDVLEIEEGLDLTLRLHISLTDVGHLTLNDINFNLEQYAEYKVRQDGEDVTDRYRILFVLPEGAPDSYVPIRVDKRPIELTTQSAEKLYDGKVLRSPGASVSFGSLLQGHRIVELSIIGEILQVGETLCAVQPQSVVIHDANGNDVTRNYAISVKTGKLTVLSPDP